MQLRTFLITLSSLALVVLATIYIQRTTTSLHGGFEQLESLQQHSVSQFAQTVLAARRYEIRALQRRLERDPNLGKELLLASEGGASRLLEERLKDIQSQCGADSVQVFFHRRLEPWGSGARLLEPQWQQRALQGESGIGVRDGKDPWLVVYAPVRLYQDTLGALAIGLRLNGRIAQEVSRATGTEAHFGSLEIPDAFLISVPVEANLQIPLTVRGGILQGITQSTEQRVVFWGLACLLSVIALVYFALEFVFVRRFRRLVAGIQSNADALKHGQVRSLPSDLKQGLGEMGRLWEALDRYTESLEAFQRRIQEKSANEAVGKMAAQVAHDLQSPLAALQMYERSGALDELSERPRALLRSLTKRIQDIVRNLQTRPQPSLSPVCERVDPSSILRGIIEEKQIQYRDRPNLSISQADTAPTSLQVSALPAELRRVISNLIDNAVEALPEGGNIRIAVAQALPNFVDVIITDNGLGISPEIQKQLFQRGATFGKEKGTGLGLWYARETLAAWDAEVRLDSSVGKGTEVTLRFPVTSSPTGASSLPPILGLFLAICFAYDAPAFGSGKPLHHALANHRIVPSAMSVSHDGKLGVSVQVFLEGNVAGASTSVDREYVLRLVRYKLNQARIAYLESSPNLQESILDQSASLTDALRPKLILSLSEKRLGADPGIDAEIVWLQAKAQREHFSYVRIWEKRQRFALNDRQTLEEEVSRMLQRELGRFASIYKPTQLVAESSHASTQSDIRYRTEFRDEESTRSRFGIGAVAGAPLPLAIRGVWLGSIDYPLSLAVSAIYLGVATRGTQLDLGYVFDRTGEWKQTFNLSTVVFNETSQIQTILPLGLGRTATQTDVFQRMRAYSGFTYAVDWNGLHLGAGALFPIDSLPGRATHIFMQAGYVPWVF